MDSAERSVIEWLQKSIRDCTSSEVQVWFSGEGSGGKKDAPNLAIVEASFDGKLHHSCDLEALQKLIDADGGEVSKERATFQGVRDGCTYNVVLVFSQTPPKSE